MTTTDKVAIGVLAFTAVTSALTASQVRESTKQNKEIACTLEATVVLKIILDYLQRPEEIEARRRVYELHHQQAPFAKWHADEDDRRKADSAMRSYEVIAIMVRRGLLDRNIVMAMWGKRAILIDEFIDPYREHIRRIMGDPDSYENLRWLAAEARQDCVKEQMNLSKHHQRERSRKYKFRH
jgi:hypothetical protein